MIQVAHRSFPYVQGPPAHVKVAFGIVSALLSDTLINVPTTLLIHELHPPSSPLDPASEAALALSEISIFFALVGELRSFLNPFFRLRVL